MSCIRVMGAVIDAIKARPLPAQKLLHLTVDLMDERFGEITPGHAGLIGDNDRLQAMTVQQPDSLAGPTLPELLTPLGVRSTLLADDPAVTEHPLANYFDEVVSLDITGNA